jgi:hypothetical protein
VSQADPQFKLRFPASLRDAIQAAADANGRTMNAEIVFRLGGAPPADVKPRSIAGDALRDQFALQALHGIIDDCGLSADEVANRCYEVADAMVARRNRGAA